MEVRGGSKTSTAIGLDNPNYFISKVYPMLWDLYFIFHICEEFWRIFKNIAPFTYHEVVYVTLTYTRYLELTITMPYSHYI